MTETKPGKSISRRQFLALAATTVGGAALAACGESPTPTPEPGTLTDEKVGAWDPIIDHQIDQNPFLKAQIKKEREGSREFFAVIVSHNRNSPPDIKAVKPFLSRQIFPHQEEDSITLSIMPSAQEMVGFSLFPKGAI